MPILVAAGVFILLALSIVCFAAYRIKAKKFEFATAIWKFASLRITIMSAAEDTEPTEATEPEKPRPELKP